MLTLSPYWAVTWLTSQVREFSSKSPSVPGCLHLSSFLSFCATPDLGRWNKGARGIFPSEVSWTPWVGRGVHLGLDGCAEEGWYTGWEWKGETDVGWELLRQGLHSRNGGGYHSSPLSTPKDKKVSEISRDRSKSTTSPPKKLGLVAWYLGLGAWALNLQGDGPWDTSSFGKVARNCLYLPLYCTPVHSFAWQTKGLHIQGKYMKLVQN